MDRQRQTSSGVLLALFFLLLVTCSFATALAEGGVAVVQQVVSTPTATIFSTRLPEITLTQAPVFTLTPIPSPINCRPPDGWTAISILPGDTLESLAGTYQSTPEALTQANCLLGTTLIPGTIFYVPASVNITTPPPTLATDCGPPDTWVLYTVQAGDNLYQLSIAFGVSIEELQYANCMGESTFLKSGSRIYVPNVATLTPIPSSTPKPSKTPVPSITPTPSDTGTPTITPTPSNTPTSTPTPSSTIVE